MIFTIRWKLNHLFFGLKNNYSTLTQEEAEHMGYVDLLRTVYDNGPVESAYEDFATVRSRVAAYD